MIHSAMRRVPVINKKLRLVYACLALLISLQTTCNSGNNDLYGSKMIAGSSSAAEVMKGSTCTRRNAIRLFVPAAVQSNISTAWIVLQLANSNGQDLSKLSACGPTYSCWLTVDPPAQVVAGSLETQGTSIARLRVSFPNTASAINATLLADACGSSSQPVSVLTRVLSNQPLAQLQLLTGPSLLNSTYRIAALFSTPVAFLNMSLIDINHGELLSVSRQADDSFVLTCRGLAEGMNASVQLQPRSYQSTTYIYGGAASNKLLVEVPSLLDLLPWLPLVTWQVLPTVLGASGFVCLLAVLVAPASMLPGGVPSLLRSIGHLQQLAASYSLVAVGLPASYAASASLLSYLLLDFVPGRLNAFCKFFAIPPAGQATSSTSMTWPPVVENGSSLDALLYDIQWTSAQILVANSSTAYNAADLQAMPLPQRAVQPQLPLRVEAQPDYQAQAIAAFTSLFSCLETTVGLLLLALGAHFGVAMLVDGSNTIAQRGRSQQRVGPLAIQFPYLLLVFLLVAMPPVLFWCGRLLALRQASWAAVLVLLCSGLGGISVYLWMAQHILSATETAMLDDPLDDVGHQSSAGYSNSSKQVQAGPRVAKAAAQPGYHQNVTSSPPPSWQTDHNIPGQPLAEGNDCQSQESQQQTQPQVAGLLQALTDVLSRHQERLEQFRQRAYLSMSRKSSTAGTSSQQHQQQQLLLQDSAADTPAQLLTAAFPESSSPSDHHQQIRPSNGAMKPQVQLGSSRPQPLAEARESGCDQPESRPSSGRPGQHMLENDGDEVDEIEELQRQVMLHDLLEQRRRALVRKKLRQGRLTDRSVLSPRPLPPDNELLQVPRSALWQFLPRRSSVDYADTTDALQVSKGALLQARQRKADGIQQENPIQGNATHSNAQNQRQAEAARASTPRLSAETLYPQSPPTMRTSHRPGTGMELSNAGEQQQQQQQQRSSYIKQHGGDETASGRGDSIGSGGVADDGRYTTQVQAQPLAAQVQDTGHKGVQALTMQCNALVLQRLLYMSRHGCLTQDVVGAIGMTNYRHELALLAGCSPVLLMANVLFAFHTGVCCILYGTMGGLMGASVQVWCIAAMHSLWMLFVVAAHPFAQLGTTLAEAALSLGQVILSVLGVLAAQGYQQESVSAIALYTFVSMVLLVAVVEMARNVLVIAAASRSCSAANRRRVKVMPMPVVD